MKRFLLVAFLTGMCNFTIGQILINEFSQGNGGTKEWVEFIILNNGTNIQGVYLADDDGGFANLDFQFSETNAALSSLDAGTIIVVYNASDKDDILPADDTDISDGLIIIPHNNTTFLESGGTWPGFGNSGDDFGVFTSGGTGIHGVSYGSGSPTSDFDSNCGNRSIWVVSVLVLLLTLLRMNVQRQI